MPFLIIKGMNLKKKNYALCDSKERNSNTTIDSKIIYTYEIVMRIYSKNSQFTQ